MTTDTSTARRKQHDPDELPITRVAKTALKAIFAVGFALAFPAAAVFAGMGFFAHPTVKGGFYEGALIVSGLAVLYGIAAIYLGLSKAPLVMLGVVAVIGAVVGVVVGS